MSRHLLLEFVGTRTAGVLERVAGLARRRGFALYLAGGAVRDRLLGRDTRDLDLVWIGPGQPEAVAGELARELGIGEAGFRFNLRFLTARCTLPGSAEPEEGSEDEPLRVDFSRARREVYVGEGSLPQVEALADQPANRIEVLCQDLIRRDFTVNAMAVELTEFPACDEPLLIDPLGGAEDLERGVLRILHDRSFRDDPTRILRGVELAARLSAFRRFRPLAFAPPTRELAVAAIQDGLLEAVSGARLRAELIRCFRGAHAARAARGLAALGVDRRLGTSAGWTDADLERLERIKDSVRARRCAPSRTDSQNSAVESGSLPWVTALAALLWLRTADERSVVAGRLALVRDERRVLLEAPGRVGEVLAEIPSAEPPEETSVPTEAGTVDSDDQSRLAGLAEKLSGASEIERMLACLLAPSGVRPVIAEALELAELQLGISGGDLEARGLRGAAIGRALRATLHARRSGTLGPEGELEFALAAAGLVENS